MQQVKSPSFSGAPVMVLFHSSHQGIIFHGNEKKKKEKWRHQILSLANTPHVVCFNRMKVEIMPYHFSKRSSKLFLPVSWKKPKLFWAEILQ